MLYIILQGNSLLEVDIETGDASRKRIKNSSEPNAGIKDLYTDGERLFATGYRSSLQKEYIYEITLSDEVVDYVYGAVAKEIGE